MAVRNEDAEGNLPVTNEQLGLPEENQAEAGEFPREAGEGGSAAEEAQKEHDREELLASLIHRICDVGRDCCSSARRVRKPRLAFQQT
jgi:hypothetical protein